MLSDAGAGYVQAVMTQFARIPSTRRTSHRMLFRTNKGLDLTYTTRETYTWLGNHDLRVNPRWRMIRVQRVLIVVMGNVVHCEYARSIPRECLGGGGNLEN